MAVDAQAVYRGIRHCAQLQVDAMPWTAIHDSTRWHGSESLRGEES
jgi:hypothetical protein